MRKTKGNEFFQGFNCTSSKKGRFLTMKSRCSKPEHMSWKKLQHNKPTLLKKYVFLKMPSLLESGLFT